MISSAEKTMTVLGISFRLLNSEIGNDQIFRFRFVVEVQCFRLLNSEIGNDQLKRMLINKGLTLVFVSLTRR